MTTTTDVAPPSAPVRPSEATPTRSVLRRRPLAATMAVSGTGLLVQAIGYWIGWHGGTGASPWFVVGLAILMAPYCVLLTMPGVARRQRLWGSLALALTLYLSYLLASPLMAVRFDETLHVTTLVDLVQGRSFFAPHSLLPVSPYYPGLELTAAGVHWLTGMPLMACQVVVVALSRIVLVVMLFAIATRLGHSDRAGSIAVLLYAACSQFWLFNAQFAYQTLAVALAVAAFRLVLLAVDAEARWPAAPLVGAGLALTGAVVSHHLTSWFALGAFWVWGLLHLVGRQHRPARLVLSFTAVMTVVTTGWTMLVGRLVSHYLLPAIADVDGEVRRLLLGEGGERDVLSKTAENATPLWELALMFAAMVLWCALLVAPSWQTLRGRLLTRSPARFVVLVVGAAYPLAFVARLLPNAAEMGERATTFIALAAAVMVAAWAVRHVDRVPKAAIIAAALVMLLGGVLLGSGPRWERVPGSYLASAEQRSIDHESISVARWAQRYLPAGSRFGADVTLSRFLPDYAPVLPVTSIGGGDNIGPVFYHASITPEDRALLVRDQVDFLVVDTRLADQPARSGSIFEAGDPDAPSRLTSAELEKFDTAPGFVKVLSGPISVYDVRDLRLEPRVFADRPGSTLPGDTHPAQMYVAAAIAVVLGAILLLWSRRRAWRVERLLGGDGVGLTAVLPACMAVGAVGVLAGYRPATGSVLLGVLAVGALALAQHRLHGQRRSVRALLRPRGEAGAWLLGGVVVLAYAAAITIAVIAAWQGLLEPATTLPAPRWGGI